MDEGRGYQGKQMVGGFAGILFFALAVTAPFAAEPMFDDCIGCGPSRLRSWVIFIAIWGALALAFGFAVRAIHDWLGRRRRAAVAADVEPPGLAISTVTMLLIFLGIWCGGILWR